MKKSKKIAVILACLLLVGVGAYGVSKARTGKGVPVTTALVKQEPMVVKVFATGRVKTQAEETLFAPFTGVVEELLVEAGDQVEEGQALIRFDTDELARKLREAEARLKVEEANLKKIQVGPREEELDKGRIRLEQAELGLAHAKERLERLENLFNAGATTAENLTAAKQEVANQEYAVQLAQKDLDLLTKGERPEVLEAMESQKKEAENSLLAIKEQLEQGEVKSPMAGTVLDVQVNPGQLVTQGGTLLVVGDLSRLIVEVNIGEGDSRELALGQKVEITGTSFAGTYTGIVSKIAPAGKSVSANQPQTVIPVEIAIEGSPPIKPGVSAEVNIITVHHPEALVLPYEAIVEDEDGQEWVFVVQEGKVEKRSVTLGTGNELYREVLDGLSAGEEVVINPPPELEDQTEVTVLPDTGSSTGR